MLTKSLKKIFVEVSSGKVSDLRKFSFHIVLKTLIEIIAPLILLLIYLSNPLKRKRLTSHVRKQTKQNALKLIQVHVEENKIEIKPWYKTLILVATGG